MPMNKQTRLALSYTAAFAAAATLGAVAGLLPVWTAACLAGLLGSGVLLAHRRKRTRELGFRIRLAAAARPYADSDPPTDAGREELLGFLADSYAQHVDDLKRAQRAIIQSNLHFDQIFNATDDALRVIDLEGNVVMANEAYAGLSHLGRREASGGPCRASCGFDVCGTMECPLHRIRDGEPGVVVESAFHRADGTEVACLISASPYRDHHGSVVGIVEWSRDITPLKRAHDKLRRYARELERKNDYLAELTATAHRFVDTVAHEFRTPLTVIGEFASILADGIGGDVNEEQTKYLQMIRVSAGDLSQMVDDLLDSSRLKTGTLKIDRQAVTAGQIVRSVWDVLLGKAAGKNVTLTLDVPDDLPPAYADPTRAARCVANLVLNAVKFSPDGGEIRVWAAPSDDGGLEIGVTDQGPGLTPQEQQLIFDRFSQCASGLLSTDKGFGLGLSIVQEMAGLNLGQVRVESTPGEGSTFSFTLPPCRVDAVLQQFLGTLAASATEDQAIAVIAGRSPSDPPAREQTVRDLRDLCRTTDLVLPARDGVRAIVIGLSHQPDAGQRWIHRVRETASAGNEDLPTSLPLELQVIGEWDPSEASEVLQAVLPEVSLPTMAV